MADGINDLAARAKAKHLTADDLSGATFTITNVGSYGTLVTAPIINQPQVAILSTDGVAMRPVAVRAAGDGVGHRRPPGRQPEPELRPPRLRRRLRRRVPGRACADLLRDRRLVGEAET